MSPILGIWASQNYPRITNSYESIATINGTGLSTLVTFSSIPSTYKHLQIRAVMRDTNGSTGYGEPIINFNAVTSGTGNYVKHYLRGDGSSASAGYFNNFDAMYGSSYPRGGSYPNVVGAQIIDILDYTNTNKNKVIRVFGGFDGNGAGEISLWSGMLYSSQPVVSSITIGANLSGFTTGSTFALYGIKG